MTNPRKNLSEAMAGTADEAVEIASRFVSAPSKNPPGDTDLIAKSIPQIAQSIEGTEVELVTSVPPTLNVVVRMRGKSAGQRLVFNGHLDTFPAGERAGCETYPFSPTVCTTAILPSSWRVAAKPLRCPMPSILSVSCVVRLNLPNRKMRRGLIGQNLPTQTQMNSNCSTVSVSDLLVDSEIPCSLQPGGSK